MSRRSINPKNVRFSRMLRYNSVQVQAFINSVMRNGKKSVAARLVYDAIEHDRRAHQEERAGSI